MEIIVCIKQVPDTQKVQVDPKTGVLLRDGIESKMNPYDLYAIETALQIKEKTQAKVSVLTMGPPSAKEVLYEALALGCDAVYLMSDRKFAGADVLATSFTLAQGIKAVNDQVDLIICGKQTTDGDTAQVGPSIAEHLGLTHVSWVKKIEKVDNSSIVFVQDFSKSVARTKLSFPCLLTVENTVYQPRLPSFTKKKQTESTEIQVLTFEDLNVKDETRYGLKGSPTQVERIFEPTKKEGSKRFSGDFKEVSNNMYETLKDLKFVQGDQNGGN